MATALGDEWVVLDGATSDLMVGSHAILLTEAEGLGVNGESRGSDLSYAQQDGLDAYPRFGGSTAVSLSLFVDGRVDEDGLVVADPAANALTLYDQVNDWVADNDRACTVEWHRPDKTLSAVARVVRPLVWSRIPPAAWTTDMLLTVPSGTWTSS